MRKNMDIKKIVIVLFTIMFISFLIAFILFPLTGGIKGFVFSGETAFLNKEKIMDIKGINNIEINVISEDVIIIPTNNREAKVCFYTNASEKNNNFIPELIISNNNKDLIINIKHKKIFQITMFNFHERSRLELYLPVDYSKDISIATVSGDIFMDSFKLNNINYKSVSGNIKLDKVYAASNISAKTTSGDIKINGECNNFNLRTISGDFSSSELFTKESEFKTTSGNISIKEFKGDFISNHVSGDIKVNYLEFNNDISIKTTSGDIEIVLPQNAEFKLNFNSTSGDCESDFPITVKNINRKHNIEGIIGDGRNKIEVTTVSGDLDIMN